MTQTAEQLNFDFLPQLAVVVQRQAEQITSDAGLLVIAQFDHQWNYSRRMAQCLGEWRIDPEHTLEQMLCQRLYGILADYEDCNDHDTLRDDPILKIVAGKLPEDDPLASQPTLSRFENSVTIRSLHKLMDFLIQTGIEQLKEHNGGKLPARLTLDLDPTDDPTHGQQQLTLFNGYYEQYQYFPLIISEPTSKHIFLAWLRPGTMHAALGADDDLMKVVNALRQERPDIAIHVRGDAGFGMPWMYKVCEDNGLTYTFGLATNSRLKAKTEGLMRQAVQLYEKTNQKQRLFMALEYQADTWDRSRKVIAKAECHEQGTNLRFVITNLPVDTQQQAQAAQQIYDDYVMRGESEQRMDEIKNGLHADRLSCHRFLANFWRLLLHVAAYNLLAALRHHPDLPPVLRHGQPCTWRTHLIKVAATVVQTTRRIVVKLAGQWPWWNFYEQVARRALNFSPICSSP